MTTPVYQGSFTTGEITPELWGRVDIARYQSSLALLRNFVVHVYGGVSRRTGTKYLGSAKYAAKKCRLIPFEYNSDLNQAYAMEFGDKYIRWWLPTGIVLTTDDAIYEVVSPYAEADLDEISWVQSADTVWLFHPDYPPYTLVRKDHDNWTLSVFQTTGGPYQDENTTDVTITPTKNMDGTVTLAASADTFVASHVGQEFRLRQRISEIEDKDTITSGADVTGSLGPLQIWGEWEVVTTGQGPTVSQWWEGEITISRKYPDGSWQALRKFTVQRDRDLAITGVEEEDFAEYKVDYTLHTNPGDPGGTPAIPVSTMTIQLHAKSATKIGSVRISSVTTSKVAVGSETSAVGEFGSATTLWSEPAWGSTYGYPRCGAFYQDRLFMGGSKTQPQTIWGSKTASYADFGISSPIVDDDGITRTLTSRRVSRILSMVPLSELIVLTSGTEFRISSSDNGVITPLNFNARAQSYDGSAPITPEVLANRVFFVQQTNKEIRDFAYSWEADSYSSSALSLLSRHFFDESKIIDLGWQRWPDSILWCLCADGTMLGCSYLKEQEVIGWHKHETQGKFESICCIAGVNQTDVYLAVDRNEARHIELLSPKMEGEAEDSFYLDSGLSYSGAPVTALSGLDHLEGMTVGILADGNVEPDQEVVDGAIALQHSASKVHVGLKYSSELQTLDLEYTGSNGKYQGKMKKISELKVRLINSRGGEYGTDFSRMIKMKEHMGSQDGSSLPLRSGIFEIVVPTAWDYQGRVCIRQEDPLPMNVLAIIPEVAQGG